MAESKFLKYQDKDGNGLIDVCDDVVSIPEAANCPDCLKDPTALIPDWKTSTEDEPFLNQQTCEYQITIQTKYSTTCDDSTLEQIEAGILSEDAADKVLNERFEEYANDAIEALLDYYEKDDSDSSRLAIKSVIDYTEYDLDPRPNSRLKLLYSVPFTDLNDLEDASDDEEEEDEEEEAEVTYEPSDLEVKLIRVRKGLNLYSRYQKVAQFVDGDNLYFLDSGIPFSLDDYGDAGLLPGRSILANIIPELDGFLNQKGYDIPFAGRPFGGIGLDKVTKLVFKFTTEYELKKLTIYTQTCGEKPIIFTKKLKSLKNQSAFKDPTAMAYLAKLEKMERDLTAREPTPWLEFVTEYTYPEIYNTINAAYANTDPEKWAVSCMAESLQKEGKQLGQDILDEVFGIGDAVAYAFRNSVCQNSLDDVLKDWEKKKGDKTLKQMAMAQVLKSIKDEDPIFEKMCLLFLMGEPTGRGPDVNAIWKDVFDPMKKCGLFELLFGAVECLFGGLSLEQALASILKNALRSMGMEYFGDLFVGLPPEKQAELNALVQKKLESGEMFDKASSDFAYTEKANSEPEEGESKADAEAAAEDPPLFGGFDWKKPDEMAEEARQKTSTAGSTTTRTLVVEYDAQMAETAKGALNDKVVVEAYIMALLEMYQDNYLELLDKLNKFPGAQLIAKIISTFKCPQPPLKPDIGDFIKSIQLPFCRDKVPIILPRLFNPLEFDWSIFDELWDLIKMKIEQAIIEILMMLLRKLCEIIGSAICKALETVGDMAAALPAMATGRTTLKDVIRESICGEDADDETIDDTIVDMISTLGVGGAALADTEQVLSFAEEISASTTRRELMSAFLGEPSSEFLSIIETVIEYEHPDYQDALSNKNKIGRFFKNMGNLMPGEFRKQMREVVDSLPEQDQMPANPTLCATPEQLDNFKELRCSLLEGRATKAQCDQMFDNMQRSAVNDLDQLGNIIQNFPQFLADSMPPVQSSPGCDDGLIPYESEEMAAANTQNLSSELDQLKMDFSYDMLGNGPFKHQWGFINMIMSDTMGKPFTAHKRKSHFLRRRYVDYYVDLGQADGDEADAGETAGSFVNVWKQKGAYPNKLAGWLEDDLQAKAAAGISFTSANDVEEDEVFKKSFDDFGINNFKGSPQHLLMLPDMGYNVERGVDIENEQITFTRKARKATPDVTLTFYDNGQGEAERKKMYVSGFEMNMYVSDIEQSGSTYVNRYDVIEGEENGETVEIKIPSDNVRILINELQNSSNSPDSYGEYKTDEEKEAEEDDVDGTTINRQYEFLSVEDTLSEVDTSAYPEFLAAFETEQSYTPQVILLKEMVNEQGYSYTNKSIKSLYDDFMSSAMTEFMTVVSENSASFDYGAVFDDLTADDVTYIVDDGQTESDADTEYFEAEVDDGDGGTRAIKNDDQILGISRMQYERGEEDNRVVYLDPIQYGGSYMNPPLYIKPLKNKGWLGFIDVMFPEISPCKPFRTDLIDFGDINDIVSESYQTIPDDERLLSDPECVIEKPYNRILERTSAAGLEGLIMAAIRIYAATHFMKALTTFTTFYPKFPETFSSMYASYIVEVMEVSFKDAQKPGWEFFNPFKDEEFWYAFLEQSVQMYARRVDSGNIEDPSPVALNACIRLNGMQEDYDYPDRQDLREAKGLDDAAAAMTTGAAAAGAVGATALAAAAVSSGTVSIFKTLKEYRSEKNLEAVQETEDIAKLVLKELVMEQLTFMGEKFIKNLEIIGMVPSIYDLDYFLLTNLTQGGIDLDLNKEIKEETADLPDSPEEELYTGGGEMYVSEKNDEEGEFEQGDEYIGYYHAHTDEERNLQYMSGEFHNDMPQDILKPFASKVIVPIGDVQEYDYSPSASTSQPFVIEKYISINGTKTDPSAAQDEILSQDNSLNISDVYPGTLEVVTDTNDEGVGLQGELGVRYGLQFSIVVEGTKIEITSVEVDALDLPIGQFAPFEGDSKLLLCLINLLKEDDKFKLISRYIFPLNKITAMIAIYNDLAFLKSIGEKTVELGAYKSSDPGEKPGSYINSVDEFGIPIVNEGQPGWTNIGDREKKFTPFVKTWDEWDKELLIQSNSRIKRLFKNYYRSREFTAGDEDKDTKIGKILLNELRERFKPAAGRQLLPWWKKRMLKTNPFNANGELCENSD